MYELNNDLDYDEDADFVNFDNNNSSNHIKYIEPDKKGITKLNQMQEIDEKMKATDWFDKNSEHLSTVNTSPIRPDQNLSGLEWKAVVQSKRQNIINERNKS